MLIWLGRKLCVDHMGKLDEIGQSEHWQGEMDRARTSSKNDLFQVNRGNVQVV